MFFSKRQRREKIRKKPFPPEWLDILTRNVPYYSLLATDEQAELQDHIKVFLDEKKFRGRCNLKITDEIRVTIAAQACILLLNRETDFYPGLRRIDVYPKHYLAMVTRQLPDGSVRVEVEARSGESRHHGKVKLSWDEVQKGAADVADGENIVLHEFAHQLDSESGRQDGSPVFPLRTQYLAWARVLGYEYRELHWDSLHGQRSELKKYGAKNPAEFFAVATEMFFERPRDLKTCHPALYQQMKTFYQQDPADRYHPDLNLPKGRKDVGNHHQAV